MVDIAIDLSGDKELRRQLAKAGSRGVKRAARTATGRSMTAVARAARRLAPKDEGVLRKSIGKRTKTTRSGDVSTIVGPRSGNWLRAHGRPANLASLLEYGTRHQAPQPFIRPAFDGQRGNVSTTFRRVLAAALLREITRK